MNKDLAQRALQDLASALDSLVESGAITNLYATHVYAGIVGKMDEAK